ncbi:monovalent cation/H+ antiporter subunit D [Thiothrix winogradskyi]|uniref:Monovalent cation/H+ antiporter subunit D n=1 Tax=Thiothrix winogradskyi TaxID=96472 RepID=A0ABY3STK5_9GAMM|nr:monovalent cation/H+ antiporter subunit D [Thiothrix winogradskyi]UJS22765.1 monovalent cation/H+ antiporter subunit D [Thiothrix winogradskyi]
MMHLPILPILLPLLAGILLLLLRPLGLQVQRMVGFAVTFALLMLAVWLFDGALVGQRQVYALGHWPAPFGITLVFDQLAALMLLLTAILAVGALWYAIVTEIDAQGSHFHVLFQMQLFGLNGAFLTGDAFNLFVFFEVLLLASYSLLLHGGGKERTVAGLHYVVVNLVGSTVFLFALGALYGALGTLNIADMAAKVAELPAEREGLVMAAGLLLLLVFGLKAAMFPLYLWLPAAYANTSAPVAALFAIMTKVGVYAIIRVHGTVFGEDAGSLAYFYAPWLLGLGLITLVLAALGVLAAFRLRIQVAYLVLASVAMLLIAVGLHSETGLAAALYYLVHSTLLAGGLFLLADVIVRGRGAYADRFDPGMRLPHHALLGGLFMFAAVAALGLPPLSGFFGKLWILQAALEHPWRWAVLATVLISSAILLIALARSGSVLFYKVKDRPDAADPVLPAQISAFAPSLMAVLWLLAAVPLLVLLAQPVAEIMQQIAAQTLDTAGYRAAVFDPAVGGK